MNISLDRVAQVRDTHLMNKTTAFASDLGLAPGAWPNVIELHGITYTRLLTSRDREGDVILVTYVGKDHIDNPAELEVFND